MGNERPSLKKGELAVDFEQAEKERKKVSIPIKKRREFAIRRSVPRRRKRRSQTTPKEKGGGPSPHRCEVDAPAREKGSRSQKSKRGGGVRRAAPKKPRKEGHAWKAKRSEWLGRRSADREGQFP